jgi:hypothetical protein
MKCFDRRRDIVDDLKRKSVLIEYLKENFEICD